MKKEFKQFQCAKCKSFFYVRVIEFFAELPVRHCCDNCGTVFSDVVTECSKVEKKKVVNQPQSTITFPSYNITRFIAN